MITETGRFRSADRILDSREFRRIMKSGKRRASKDFVVVVAPQSDLEPSDTDGKDRRLGVTVSKRVGNAVVRNHVKRRIREWFRHMREGLPKYVDVVVIARGSARYRSGREISEALTDVTAGMRPREVA